MTKKKELKKVNMLFERELGIDSDFDVYPNYVKATPSKKISYEKIGKMKLSDLKKITCNRIADNLDEATFRKIKRIVKAVMRELRR